MQEDDEYLRILKKAYIEITNSCNRSCSFCPGTTRPAAFMSEEGFMRVLAELAGKVRCLYFHVMGEPLLHPRLELFLDRAHEAGFPVNLTTNGTMLGSIGDMLLTKPALWQVNVSLHSLADDEVGRHHLEDIIAFALKARKQGSAYLSYRLWNMQSGGGNPGNDWIMNRLASVYGADRAALNKMGGKSRGVKLGEGVYLNNSVPFQWPDITLPEKGSNGFCMGLRDQIGILCDGTVVPCCLDGGGVMALGNVFRQPMAEILSSSRAEAIYQGFSNRKAVEELCRKCGYRQRFET